MLRPSQPFGLLETESLETIPILAKASPLNPSVLIFCKSSADFNLEVACLSNDKLRSCSLIPPPSSSIFIRSNPPLSIVILICEQPASRLFSINSLTT